MTAQALVDTAQSAPVSIEVELLGFEGISSWESMMAVGIFATPGCHRDS
jgi:hypothetical protein